MRVLHHHWLSAGSRFCRILLAEKNLDALQKLENWWAPERNFLAINPAGAVPVIVEDDGTILAGVWPIAEYMEETHPAPPFLPGSPARRATTRRLVDWYAGKMEREVLTPLLRERFLTLLTPDASPSSAAIRAASGSLKIHLQYADYLAGRHHWLGGDDISLADLHAAASLSVCDYFGIVAWDDYTHARDWYARMKSRPSFRSLLTDKVDGVTPPLHYSDLDF